MAGSHWEEATAWEDTGGIPGSPEGHPSAQPCSCAHSTADRSCFRKMWTSLTPGTVPPWGRMCISSPGKIPSRGVVPVRNPHQPHPEELCQGRTLTNPIPTPACCQKTTFSSGKGLGRSHSSRLLRRRYLTRQHQQKTPVLAEQPKCWADKTLQACWFCFFLFFFFQPKVVSCSNGNFQEQYWRDNLCKCQPSSCTTCSVCA